jgi:multiple sugar transport system permease protein
MATSTAVRIPRTKRQADRRFATWLMSPSLFVILLVCVFPLAYGIVLSFCKYELALPVPVSFVGLQNYLKVLQDPKFWNAAKISAIMVVGGAAVQLSLGFGAALLVSDSFRGRSAIVSLLLIPTTIAPVVVGFVFRMILNDRFGPLNYLLNLLGLPDVPWLSNPSAAVAGVILANGWEWFPFVMLVILAGLQSIPQELSDAAMVDGASGWHLFWRVTLPLLQPIVIVVFLIRAIEDLKLFDIIYVVTGGGPGIATQTMNMYAYQRGFTFFSIGYASALSYVQLIITLILVRALFGRLSQTGEGS